MSRIILKLSGEALAGPKSMGFDENTVRGVAVQVRQLVESGYEVGVVTGGGNFWRGRTGNEIDRVKADQIGMLATVMNCLYVSEIFRTEGMKTAVMTPFMVGAFTELYSKDKASQYFHSTSLQAATCAKDAEVGKLIVGHYSSRIKDIDSLAEECKEIFPESFTVNDGDIFEIPYIREYEKMSSDSTGVDGCADGSI